LAEHVKVLIGEIEKAVPEVTVLGSKAQETPLRHEQP
jgi:hypothetical protein